MLQVAADAPPKRPVRPGITTWYREHGSVFDEHGMAARNRRDKAPALLSRPRTREETLVLSEPTRTTIYFDGSCPLCRAEIGHYRRADQTDALCFVDVSRSAVATPEGVSQRQAMARFHVRTGDGRVLSGAAAFVEVWSHLPPWRWAARVAALPGILAALELGYRLFLPVRPLISGLLRRVLRKSGGDAEHP
jgi:predicted DCC family thiol-disulfide oxidoreductase YuxK